MQLKRSFLCILSLLFLCFIDINVYAVTATVDEQREAVLETALAFYNKGVYVQYDQNRRMNYATPEDATSDEYVYNDCSSFIYEIYNGTLGMTIPTTTANLSTYAQKNKGSSNVLIYKATKSEIYASDGIGKDSSDVKNAINNLKKIVKTGDILVLRRADSGHVMFIEVVNGELYIIHSSGGMYNSSTHTDTFETNGTIKREPLENYLLLAHKNYTITQMSLIRFITDGKTYINSSNKQASYNGLTAAGAARLKYSQITINKTSKVINSDIKKDKNYVAPGDTIQYTITIKNNSKTKKYGAINVIEQKDSKVSFVSKGGGTVSGNKISWKISSLDPGKSYTINYTVKVPNKSNLIGSSITSTGSVSDIKNKTITLRIGNSLTKAEENSIINTYNSLKKDTSIETEFIVKIYQQALGIDMSSLNNKIVYDLLGISSINSSLYRSKVTDSYAKRVVLKNFYGYRIASSDNVSKDKNHLINAGYAWNKGSYDENDRARDITAKDLQVGDVIIAYSETSGVMRHKAYLYIGDSTLVRKTSATNITVHSDGKNGYYSFDTLLRNMVGDNYIIIRPAFVINREYKEDKPTTNNQQSKPTEETTNNNKPSNENSLDTIDNTILEKLSTTSEEVLEEEIQSEPTVESKKENNNLLLNISAIIGIILVGGLIVITLKKQKKMNVD